MTDDKLVTKLARACASIGSFQADKRNEQQRYDYISADQVLSRVGNALAAEGVMIIPAITEEIIDLVQPKPNQSRYDALVALEMNITDGNESIVQQWIGRGSDYSVPDKALYKAITSGHKYFLMKLCNVGAGNEDGDHESEKEPTRAKQVPPSNGRKPEPEAEPLPDDELVIYEGSAANFWINVLALIDRYTVAQHAQAAAKKLGYKSVPGAALDRLEMYRALKVEAARRDVEDADEDAEAGK